MAEKKSKDEDKKEEKWSPRDDLDVLFESIRQGIRSRRLMGNNTLEGEETVGEHFIRFTYERREDKSE